MPQTEGGERRHISQIVFRAEPDIPPAVAVCDIRVPDAAEWTRIQSGPFGELFLDRPDGTSYKTDAPAAYLYVHRDTNRWYLSPVRGNIEWQRSGSLVVLPLTDPDLKLRQEGLTLQPVALIARVPHVTGAFTVARRLIEHYTGTGMEFDVPQADFRYSVTAHGEMTAMQTAELPPPVQGLIREYTDRRAEEMQRLQESVGVTRAMLTDAAEGATRRLLQPSPMSRNLEPEVRPGKEPNLLHVILHTHTKHLTKIIGKPPYGTTEIGQGYDFNRIFFQPHTEGLTEIGTGLEGYIFKRGYASDDPHTPVDEVIIPNVIISGPGKYKRYSITLSSFERQDLFYALYGLGRSLKPRK